MPPKEIRFMGVQYEPSTREFLSPLMMRLLCHEEEEKKGKGIER